jgi:hypothetical protein
MPVKIVTHNCLKAQPLLGRVVEPGTGSNDKALNCVGETLTFRPKLGKEAASVAKIVNAQLP